MQFFWSPFLNIGITLACFIVSGSVADEKDKLLKSEIVFEKNFLNSLRILVGILPEPIDLCVLSVP